VAGPKPGVGAGACEVRVRSVAAPKHGSGSRPAFRGRAPSPRRSVGRVRVHGPRVGPSPRRSAAQVRGLGFTGHLEPPPRRSADRVRDLLTARLTAAPERGGSLARSAVQGGPSRHRSAGRVRVLRSQEAGPSPGRSPGRVRNPRCSSVARPRRSGDRVARAAVQRRAVATPKRGSGPRPAMQTPRPLAAPERSSGSRPAVQLGALAAPKRSSGPGPAVQASRAAHRAGARVQVPGPAWRALRTVRRAGARPRVRSPRCRRFVPPVRAGARPPGRNPWCRRFVPARLPEQVGRLEARGADASCRLARRSGWAGVKPAVQTLRAGSPAGAGGPA